MPSIGSLTGLTYEAVVGRLTPSPMDPSLPGWRTLHPGTTGGKKKRRMRERAWINDGGLCQLCAEPVPYVLATADRILPGALGGAYHQGNLWTACWPCNQRKADGIVPRFAFASRDRLIELGLVST